MTESHYAASATTAQYVAGGCNCPLKDDVFDTLTDNLSTSALTIAYIYVLS